MKIALKQKDTGKLLHVVNGGDDAGVVAFDRDVIGEHETFTVYSFGQNYVALETVNRRFLSRSPQGEWTANRCRKSDGQTHRMDLRTVPDDPIQLPTDAWESFNYTKLGQAFEIVIIEGGTASPPPRLHTSGWDIVTEDGHRWVCRGATNFLLFQRFLEGQDIEGLLYKDAEVYRVTGTMKWVPAQVGLKPLLPENYPDYWRKLDLFADWLASRGKRLEFTALCDMRDQNLDLGWQQRFTDQVYEVLRPKSNVLVELANEPEHGTNQVEYAKFTHPQGIFWSRGSSLGGQKCPLPPGNYSTIHPPRSGANMYTDLTPIYMIEGYSGYDGVHGPCTFNEPIGADENNKPGSRSNDPAVFFRTGRMISAWNGGMFHSTDGVFSRPLGPTQERCRQAFFQGLNVDSV